MGEILAIRGGAGATARRESRREERVGVVERGPGAWAPLDPIARFMDLFAIQTPLTATAPARMTPRATRNTEAARSSARPMELSLREDMRYILVCNPPLKGPSDLDGA